jgi:NAD+ diphosphatase
LLFDRAAHLRKDRELLHRMLSDPGALVLPVWRDQSFVTPGGALPQLTGAGELLDCADEIVWLGMRGPVPCFALDLSSTAEPLALPALAGAGQFTDLRMLLTLLPAEELRLLAYARGMLHWHRYQRFCSKCGRLTHPKEGGHVRECEGCEHKYFPRTDPAVMILITDGSRCLLARQPAFPRGMYSSLAGFVETGETLEEAVVREAREEVGLDVEPGAYLGSQGWPFPASLMLGFHAIARSRELRIDRDELEEARWFTRDELRSPDGFFIPPPFSLANRLIGDFLDSE